LIVALHVATGAVGGALTRSRLGALALGPVLHLAGDMVPHQDFSSPHFELRSGLVGLGLLAALRGPLDPATICAAAASAPDLEHILPLPRPGGRELFPSHRIPGLHQAGGISAPAQLAVASVLLALVLRAGR
jgi:hypothetical protein